MPVFIELQWVSVIIDTIRLLQCSHFQSVVVKGKCWRDIQAPLLDNRNFAWIPDFFFLLPFLYFMQTQGSHALEGKRTSQWNETEGSINFWQRLYVWLPIIKGVTLAGIKIYIAMSHYIDSYIFFMRNKKWNCMGNETWIQNVIHFSIVYKLLADRVYKEVYLSSLFKGGKGRVQGISQLWYMIISN